MCNAAMLIQAHTLSQGRAGAAVKHLRPAEIESTSKLFLGPLGLDPARAYWRAPAGSPPPGAPAPLPQTTPDLPIPVSFRKKQPPLSDGRE